MQKICEFFEVDFNHFVEPSIQNNVKVNKKGVVGTMNGSIIFNQKKDNYTTNQSND